MCGREPNFELSEKEKEELRKFKWDEFLAMTRHAITNKSNISSQRFFHKGFQNSISLAFFKEFSLIKYFQNIEEGLEQSHRRGLSLQHCKMVTGTLSMNLMISQLQKMWSQTLQPLE